jgi:hypothetical protein
MWPTTDRVARDDIELICVSFPAFLDAAFPLRPVARNPFPVHGAHCEITA